MHFEPTHIRLVDSFCSSCDALNAREFSLTSYSSASDSSVVLQIPPSYQILRLLQVNSFRCVAALMSRKFLKFFVNILSISFVNQKFGFCLGKNFIFKLIQQYSLLVAWICCIEMIGYFVLRIKTVTNSNKTPDVGFYSVGSALG